MKRHELHKMKQLPYQVLLDYADGALSKEETTVLNEYFEENPDDVLVAKGAKLFYEIEQTDRDGLETYLNTEITDVDFLFAKIKELEKEENISKHVSDNENYKNLFWFGKWSTRFIHTISLVASIACFAVICAINWADLISPFNPMKTKDISQGTNSANSPTIIANGVGILYGSGTVQNSTNQIFIIVPKHVLNLNNDENPWTRIAGIREGYSGSPIFSHNVLNGMIIKGMIDDMNGNVWGWCSNWTKQDSYYPLRESTVFDSGNYRVMRGGRWNHRPYYLSTGNLMADTDQLLKEWWMTHDCEFGGNGASDVIFSPHEKGILTGSWDNTARLWALKGGNIQQSEGHSNSISSVAFPLDDQHILVGSEDKTVRLWLLPSISNYGLTSIDIIAPGDDIYSALPDKDYRHLSGTSMAAPYMSSRAAALLYSQDSSIKNEWLYNQELYNFQLNADMVVLSACETGIGKLQRGEGIISHAKSFSDTGSLGLNALDLYLDLGSYRDSTLISWVPATQYASNNASWTDAIYMSMEQTAGYFSLNPEFEFIDDQRAFTEGSVSMKTTINVDSSGQWAGWFIQYGLKASKQKTFNMCTYEGGNLKFWVKAEPGVKDLIVGIRSKDVLPDNERSNVLLSNYSQFEADDQWHEVTIPLQDFLGVDFSQVAGLFSIMTNSKETEEANGNASFWIDDVRWIKPSVAHPSKVIK